MYRIALCFVICALFNPGQSVSSKMDFGNDESAIIVANETKAEDEDVEVKHTIVVSTRLKNNNRRGLHGRGEGDPGVLTYNVGSRSGIKEDSGEVPVVDGYKSVDTTQIRSPDSRHKGQIYPDSVFVSRNIRDDYGDVYPNVALTPSQWKPSTFYNNVNWWQDGRQSERRNYRPINNNKLNRKITDDAMKDFYCKKCRELSGGQNGRGCIQQRSSWLAETTTPRVKIDGKLAKLN